VSREERRGRRARVREGEEFTHLELIFNPDSTEKTQTNFDFLCSPEVKKRRK
jgi:hypothetical protein